MKVDLILLPLVIELEALLWAAKFGGGDFLP